MGLLKRSGQYLGGHQRVVLLGLLGVLHVTLLTGTDNLIGLMFWLGNVGLFLLWQPFVRGEKQLGRGELLFILAALVAGSWLYGTWLLVVWVGLLAALLGGRVLMITHRPTRLFYLLAFAYLLGALLIALIPRVVPGYASSGLPLEAGFSWGAPLLIALMAMIRIPAEVHASAQRMVDLLYSLFVFFMIAVLTLGSLAFMLLSGASYVEAVVKASLSLAGALLVLAFAWDTRRGFGGFGALISRYYLNLGMPFENWLQKLMQRSAAEPDPERFLSATLAGMVELPWVVGVAWQPSPGARGGYGQVGETSLFVGEFPGVPLRFSLFSVHKLSPALVWHFHLLLQLTNDYYAAKQRSLELQRVNYLEAVHETGARLTHDVKNLLQSLNALCYAAQQPSSDGDDRLRSLLSRQLPLITHRLGGTLEKLRRPEVRSADSASGRAGDAVASMWWTLLCQRYENRDVVFDDVRLEERARVPAELFDSAIDNLLENALSKQQMDASVRVSVTLQQDASALRVKDTGRAIDASLAGDLFAMPVSSEMGLGTGLYHAARLAEGFGFALSLVSNVDGNVCFELRRAAAVNGLH